MYFRKEISYGSRKGFTLVELIIVMAVIGILASSVLVSFSAAQKAGRDARRITDLQQVQHALQLFYGKCSHFLGVPNCTGAQVPCGSNPTTGLGNSCSLSSNELNQLGPTNWQRLDLYLSTSHIGVSSIPYDPFDSKIPNPGQQTSASVDYFRYRYFVQLGDITPEGTFSPVTPFGQCYILSAVLETKHRALGTDLDNHHLYDQLYPLPASPAGGGIVYNSQLSGKNLFPSWPGSSGTYPEIECGEDPNNDTMYCIANSECIRYL